MELNDVDLPKKLEIHPLGENGEMEVLPASEKLVFSTSRLPCGLPPILPDAESLLNSFLENIEELPILQPDAVQRYVPVEADVHSLYSADLCPLQTELAVKRNVMSGKLLGFSEEVRNSGGGTTKTSTSLSRAPGPPEFGIKGSTSSFPFWPGGMDEPWANIINETVDKSLFSDLLDTPPGFKSGMQFERKVLDMGNLIEESNPGKISVADVLAMDDFADLEIADESEPVKDLKLERVQPPLPQSPSEMTDIENSIFSKDQLPVLKISTAKLLGEFDPSKYNWAVVEDVSKPVDEFNEKVPNMAFNWNFELDIFQKLAVLHLEKHENVFVAAHTSAGKTVVAEYAIALSKKHMTRVIYTSPIKALSNQKFREFKQSFEDVGLITGDVCVNPTGFCLIMTTEILRSMLYHGSDVIREVEWVIFDEVHYINDAERGVVWEEVFIMLPQHVNLIMLSATVPNTAEFAEWLGGIKKRKIYVISTLKRPVPLAYYLYTGSVGKTQDEIFEVLSADGKFSESMYMKAVNAKKSRESKSKGSTGSKGARYTASLSQEKNIYIGLLGHLKQRDLLPVVCFTLSRRKCKEHAEMLISQDYTTAAEKDKIRYFFQHSISKLKKDDQKLRQVQNMSRQLERGFGVHHSGILPILKEVVEMLFQQGLVKVLFATETFAMGVNMPARTVVFDSIQKHDGKCFRDLQPSEFIQMAGRAGRRGLDKTGTVIIICKGDVPDIISLHQMMLGKPTVLKSQFRLTYNMILNLLKIKTLRVEEVMKRSFGELDNQKNLHKYQKLLAEAVEKHSKLSKPECSLCAVDLEQYYKIYEQHKSCKVEVMEKICLQAMNMRIMTPGRIIVVSTLQHENIPGVLLSIDKENKCKVLVIADKSGRANVAKDAVLHDEEIKPWTKSLFLPDNKKPEVITVTFEDVEAISNKTLKIESDRMLKEWQRMVNMRNSLEPGISSAFQELCNYSEMHSNGPPAVNINFKDMSLMEKYLHVQKLEESLLKSSCVHCPQFSKHFYQLSNIFKLQDDICLYQHKISEDSLLLHEEYTARKEVLQKLGYIDAEGNVQLKGSVAREISDHELLTTELLIKNVFNSCAPEVIAAVLSCMVFQQKSREKVKLPLDLKPKVSEIGDIISEIECIQKECGIYEPNFVEQYSFDLAPVVYEWAQGTTFAEIMESDQVTVEEGIVVRCIQRLYELLKEVRNAASLVGDIVLAKKMEDASRLIKRDIVFAGSLYII